MIPHMTPDDFRTIGHEMVDWLAGYWEQLEDLPVQSLFEPGQVRAMLPDHAPETGESWQDIRSDLDRVIVPGITHWQSPRFYGYFPANSSGPGVLADLISSGLGVQGMMWSTSPACTEVETHVLDWLIEMLGLPERFRSTGAGGGVIQDSASSSSLVALVAARERCGGGTPVAYTSVEAHSSIEKGCRIAGVEELRKVPTDSEFRMRPDALEAMIRTDLERGLTPAFVAATVGTTSCGSVDPVADLARICRRFGLWLHVDAAYAGTAALLPRMRWIHDGVEFADSYCFNPHKWMLTNFDCSAFYVADRTALTDVLSIVPEYLRNEASDSGAVFDYRDWQVPLGRRFRALKLWFVIRHYGVEGLRSYIEEHMSIGSELADLVERSADFELAAPVHFSLVCFRHRGGDDETRRVLDAVNGSGRALLTQTRLDGKLVMRMAIGATRTEARHVRETWDLISSV